MTKSITTWKPIKTAPKDDKPRLLYCPDGVDGDSRPDEMKNVKTVVGAYRGRNYDGTGYWISDVVEYDWGYYPGDFSTSAAEVKPTHWMELPECPKQ